LDFVRVFDRIAGRLDERGQPYALAGALALHAYGQSRATFDLDLVTVSAAQQPLLELPLEVLRARKRARGGEPFSLPPL